MATLPATLAFTLGGTEVLVTDGALIVPAEELTTIVPAEELTTIVPAS